MNRPIIVTLTGWAVLILASWNALRAWTSIAWSRVLIEYSVRLSPTISAAIAIFWTIAGLFLAWGIWQNKAWSAKALPTMAIGYTLWYWAERLIWQNPRPNVPFAIVINLVWLSLIYFTSKSLSREAYERNTENQTTQ
ncbi:MAG: hypothetical protein JNK32_05105 [Anaerolineales bacterium]|nr:hypothetical protein [Anaerolineales bacterium]